ncbi:MAG TPA: class II glutamine amidotransferase, partial [Kiloniellales bacterium]
MCRLYGFRANEPTRVECSLVYAQNALMAQSRKDLEGQTHGHGWGVAEHPDGGVPFVEKQAWAAYHGEQFKKTAARVYSKTVIAHVRRATVGPPGLENTHPFVHGAWLFAHNGTVPNFARVRER